MNEQRPVIETPVRLSVSHFSGSSDGWSIRVEDDKSSILILDIELTHEQFARVIGSQPTVVPATLYQSDKYGKEMEVERVCIPLKYEDWESQTDDMDINKQARLLAAMQGYKQGDGWHVDDISKFNAHNRSDEGYDVVVRRWV